MGLCSSCGRSKDRFKDKSTKLCGQLAVGPLNGLALCSRHDDHEWHGFSHTIAVIQSDDIQRRHSKRQQRATVSNGMAANITNPIRGLVSKRRNRYKQDGFNLDLTYITPNIIAMGYPASNIEGVYRNHIDEVVKLLDSKHPDHYYIYNLCSEKCYDKSKFHNRVNTFPFDDHNPPKIDLIQPFCQTVHAWLQQNPANVAAVHCKAGKGRTGTMICCYLLHSGVCPTAEEALNYYGQARTQDRKGVTIPSQMRYVKYYEKLLRNNWSYVPVPMYIKEIVFSPCPILAQQAGGSLCFSVSQCEQSTLKCQKVYKSAAYEVKRCQQQFAINLDLCLVLSGDVKVEFFCKTKIGLKEKVLQFWFNTFFVAKEGEREERNGCGATMPTTTEKSYVLTLKKNELDVANKKDKQNKMFAADFQLTLLLESVPRNESAWTSTNRQSIPHRPQDTPSESSEADSTELDSGEEGWESGESTYL